MKLSCIQMLYHMAKLEVGGAYWNFLMFLMVLDALFEK